MKKTLCVLIVIVVFLALAVGYIYSSRSPYIAIRKHLLMIDPVRAVTCSIAPTALADPVRGAPYIINGFAENDSFIEIRNVYVKRNNIGLYYVYSLEGGLAGRVLWQDENSREDGGNS